MMWFLIDSEKEGKCIGLTMQYKLNLTFIPLQQRIWQGSVLYSQFLKELSKPLEPSDRQEGVFIHGGPAGLCTRVGAVR